MQGEQVVEIEGCVNVEIYRIVDRETDEEIKVYMPPTARNEYNFESVSEARNSNCHGIYQNKERYKIRKYKLVLVEDDCDAPTEEELVQAEQKNTQMNKISRIIFGKSYEELDEREMAVFIASVNWIKKLAEQVGVILSETKSDYE